MRGPNTILCKLYDDGLAAKSWNGLRKLILENFDLDSPIEARCETDVLGLNLISGFGSNIYIGARFGKRFELVVNTKANDASTPARNLVEELEALDDKGQGLDSIRLSWMLEKTLGAIDECERKLVEVCAFDGTKVSVSASEPNMLIFSGSFHPHVLFDAGALHNRPHLINDLNGQREPDPAFGCPHNVKGAAPFKVSRDKALEIYERTIAAQGNLPDGFAQRSLISSITGIFIPYWLLDGSGSYDITVSRLVKTENNSYMIYRKAAGTFSFSGVPADGSACMADETMDTLGEFDYKNLVPLDSPDLSGHMAECFSDSEENVRTRMLRLLGSTAMNRAFGYPELMGLWTKERTRLALGSEGGWVPMINHSSMEIEYDNAARTLMPVWVIEVDYENRTYRVYINGQTGVTTCSLPNNVNEVENKTERLSRMLFRTALEIAAICGVASLAYGLFTGEMTTPIVIIAILLAALGAVRLFTDALPDLRKKSAESSLSAREDKLSWCANQYFDASSFTCSISKVEGPEKHKHNWPV